MRIHRIEVQGNRALWTASDEFRGRYCKLLIVFSLSDYVPPREDGSALKQLSGYELTHTSSQCIHRIDTQEHSGPSFSRLRHKSGPRKRDSLTYTTDLENDLSKMFLYLWVS